MNLPVIIIGGGGHAKVLIDILRLRSTEILGITEREGNDAPRDVSGVPVLGSDGVVLSREPKSVLLVNAVGTTDVPVARMNVFTFFKQKGYSFTSVVHPTAVIASDAVLAEGVQIMAGAIIQPGGAIGEDTIVNVKVSVDHDCRIGRHVHLSPGATLSGGVQIGDCVHIGAGATIIQNIAIGSNTLVGAGAVVLADVPARSRIAGVPARPIVPDHS